MCIRDRRYFVHTFNALVSPELYFDEHPEYFSLINGKRMKGEYQLCLTNPDVLRIAVESVRSWIKANPDATIMSVSQNDVYFQCQCDNCRAVEEEEEAAIGPVLRFVNAVADAMTSAGGAMTAERTAPATIAPITHQIPSARCTMSRRTRASPIISTPEGATRPKPTGIIQGPFGMHFAPTFPISQFAAGMHARKAATIR